MPKIEQNPHSIKALEMNHGELIFPVVGKIPRHATVVGNHPNGQVELGAIADPGIVFTVNSASATFKHNFICTHHWEQAIHIKSKAVPGGILIAPNQWPGVDVVWPSHTDRLGATGGSGLYAVLVACEMFDSVRVCGIELDYIWGDYIQYRRAFQVAWAKNMHGIKDKLILPESWSWICG